MDATTPAVFGDRRDAGRRLATRLERFRHEAPVVLALPRGGVPVAVEVAASLAAPLDLLVVRKLGEPGARVGAVAEGPSAVVDHEAAKTYGLSPERLATLREQAEADVEADARRLRAGGRRQEIVGRTVLLVDDGVTTGNSALAAAHAARRRGAARIVLAVPVIGSAALSRLGEHLDEIVCVEVAPAARRYEHAPAVADEEIVAALRDSARPRGAEPRVPEAARGMIVLASPGDTVRRTFAERGFATLELGQAASEQEFSHATERLRRLPAARLLGLGYFGLGESAEAALLAGGRPDVRAIVAAGGRPDRPAGRLEQITASTLLVVGGEDRLIVRLARDACRRLGAGERQVAVVAGASYDFSEPGALDQVAHLAAGWFARYL